jgi:serine/threonine protein kinase
VKGFGMSCPDLKVEDVQEIFTDANDIELLDSGGQKIVFTGVFNGTKYALKFMKPETNVTDLDERDFVDRVMARAEREVETMQQCNSPHLVKMGPVALRICSIDNSTILYYSEEYIDGSNLKQYFRSSLRVLSRIWSPVLIKLSSTKSLSFIESGSRMPILNSRSNCAL